MAEETSNAVFELHAFSDSSTEAYGAVVYLRKIVNGHPNVAFAFGKSRIVLRGQQNWAIARKELVAAVLSAELMKSAIDALQLPNCSKYFWCDSKVVLQWIKNPDLRLAKFIARRIDVISRLSRPNEWAYCTTNTNPADVATRPVTASTSVQRLQLWLEGPVGFLRDTVPAAASVSVREARMNLALPAKTQVDAYVTLHHFIESAPSWFALKKRTAYQIAFIDFLQSKNRKEKYTKPKLDASY